MPRVRSANAMTAFSGPTPIRMMRKTSAVLYPSAVMRLDPAASIMPSTVSPCGSAVMTVPIGAESSASRRTIAAATSGEAGSGTPLEVSGCP